MLTSKHLVDLLLEAFRAATGPQDCMIILATLEVTPESPGSDSATARLYWRRPALFGTVLLRTTDLETIEKGYKVPLHEYSIRKGIVGCGQFSDGDVIVCDWDAGTR
ncbi:hypothetical protein PG989_006544 [Apiospora arundinis]